MMVGDSYSTGFYNMQKGSLASSSADEIARIVLGLVRPKSVVDVGCGVGAWLSAFRRLGVKDAVGVDGEWLDTRMLLFPEKNFLAKDLEKPLGLGRQFDLVVSIEVAEHLPEGAAGTFVDSLVRLGPVILFSAAVPFQGGTRHINEQWPDYWAKLFAERGYVPVDCVRKRVWRNAKVAPVYAQNMLLFVKKGHLGSNAALKREFELTSPGQLSIVHPETYLPAAKLYSIARRLPRPIGRLGKRITRLISRN